MGREKSLRSKAVHFVSDLTTVFLNPISDKPPKSSSLRSPSFPESATEIKDDQLESIRDDDLKETVDGPDTSSFTAFLYSLLSSAETDENSVEEKNDNLEETSDPYTDPPTDTALKEAVGKRSFYSRGKQSVGKAVHYAARISGFRNGDRKIDFATNADDMKFSEVEMRQKQRGETTNLLDDLPGISEPSLLLSEKTRRVLYASLPALVQGKKWLLLYSTWRHGISLSTLYRRSMLLPGLSLLVVGDRKGAVFGGLIEAPLRPTTKKKYQGTNNTFVFTNTPGLPIVFRPTGANHYFTLCSTEFLAVGGGSHFALYLDGDLLNGSSSVSETYGNPCLAHSEDFEVKEIELWGFVYASKYDEMVRISQTEAGGICRW